MSEGWERLVNPLRGDKGDKGDKGERGRRGEGMTRGARRAIVVLFVLMVALAAFNLLFTAREVGQLRSAVQSECAFAADVGTAPVTGPNVSKPSKLGVSIVADSRVQFRRLGCPGHLPPPQPSFVRWARFYHLPDS